MLRNVKSRVDTSSPRSCTKTPVMSHSEKTLRKNTAQDIRKRFRNALHFTKRNKNNIPCTSPCPNAHRVHNEKRPVFKAGSEEPIYSENKFCTPPDQMIPARPTTRRYSGITPIVHPLTIRSYASEPPKNPKSCQHPCLHYKHCAAKNKPGIRSPNNISFEDKSVIHMPQMLSKSRIHNDQNTLRTECNVKPQTKDIFNTRFYTECIDPLKPRVYIEQSSKAELQSNDSKKFYNEIVNNSTCVHVTRNENAEASEYYEPAIEKSSRRKCKKLSNETSVETKSFTQQSCEEHDYILFLLKITEDIIANNFCLNDGIQNIFKRHIEENEKHLDYRKMRYHIANLCKELKIDCKDFSNLNQPKDSGESREPQCVFDKSIFRNCKRCSNLPMTPKLFKNGSSYKFDLKIDENASENRSISPSTFKMAEKCSLGRVTECTEPLASTSTLNTPKIIEILPEVNDHVSHRLEFIEKEHECEPEQENLSFEQQSKVFEKEKTKQGNMSNSSDEPFKTDLKQKDLSLKDLQVNAIDSLENIKNMDFYINLDFQDNTTSQDNSEDSFDIISKRPKYDFGKLSLDEVWSNTRNLVNQANFDRFNNMSSDNTKNNEHLEMSENTKNSELVSMVACFEDNAKIMGNQFGEIASKPKTLNSESSENHQNQEYVSPNLLQREYDQAKNIEEDITNILKELTIETKHTCRQNNEITDIFSSNEQTVVAIPTSDSSKSICENLVASSIDSVRNGAKVVMIEEQHSRNRQDNGKECIIKVIVEGSPNESDYIFIKGPIYVFKGLLDVEPQLIVLKEENNENSESENLTLDSLDSSESNKTYAIIKPNTMEEFDINIFEQLGTADKKDAISDVGNQEFVQIMNPEFSKRINFSKTLSGTYSFAYNDYDLTPEKDYTDKYHHLLVDATTSVTSVGEKEQTKQQVEIKPLPRIQQQLHLNMPSSYEHDYIFKERYSESESVEFQNKIKMVDQNTIDASNTQTRDYKNMETMVNTEKIVEHGTCDINLIDFSDGTIVTESSSNKSVQNYDEIYQNESHLTVENDPNMLYITTMDFSINNEKGNESSDFNDICEKIEANLHKLPSYLSKENNTQTVIITKENDTSVFEKSSQRMESDLREKSEILNEYEAAAALFNNKNVKHNVKLSRSDITSSKLFRIKDGFEPERSLSAKTRTVPKESFSK